MHTDEPSVYTADMRSALQHAGMVAIIAIGLSGCAAPLAINDTATPDITPEELSAHTHYLAHPQLEGREVRSRGSSLARQYIAGRFAAMGLKPWGDQADYEQPYHIGTNVLGVLPGSDPALADEYVIVSAHYDHLGKGLLWTYPGAADNAAGVAVMLEVAERMAGEPPKRTVVFAAWDGEERGFWGAAAFTRDARYDPARLAGVVNLDMMGRKAFDAVDNTLIAVGASGYPGLRQATVEAGEHAGIRVLPAHRMLVGPRSDHVAFEGAGKPWVFFTCGPYIDYHGGGDKPGKLDYEKMSRSAEVVHQAAVGLADAATIETAQPTDGADRVTLESAGWLLDRVVANYRDAHLNRSQAKKLAAIRDRLTEAADNESFTVADQNELLEQMLDELAPLIFGGRLNDDQRTTLLGQLDLYLHHPSYFVSGQKAFLAVVDEHEGFPSGEADLGEFRWHGVTDTSVVLTPQPDGRLRLSAHVPYAHGRYTFYPPDRLSGSQTAEYLSLDFTGTRDEIRAMLVLRWVKQASESEPPPDLAINLAIARHLDPGVGPFDPDKWWLSLPRVSDWESAEARLTRWVRGENDALAYLAIEALRHTNGKASDSVFISMTADTKLPAPRRVEAMGMLKDKDDLDALSALVNAADDDTLSHRVRSTPRFDETWPFYHRFEPRMVREHSDRQKAQLEKMKVRIEIVPQTVGWHAIQRLRWLTGDKERDTPQQWRDWLAEKRAGE